MSAQDKAKSAAEKGTGKLRNNSGKRPTTNPSKPKARAIRPKATSKTPAKRSKTPSKVTPASRSRHQREPDPSSRPPIRARYRDRCFRWSGGTYPHLRRPAGKHPSRKLPRPSVCGDRCGHGCGDHGAPPGPGWGQGRLGPPWPSDDTSPQRSLWPAVPASARR